MIARFFSNILIFPYLSKMFCVFLKKVLVSFYCKYTRIRCHCWKVSSQAVRTLHNATFRRIYFPFLKIQNLQIWCQVFYRHLQIGVRKKCRCFPSLTWNTIEKFDWQWQFLKIEKYIIFGFVQGIWNVKTDTHEV